MLATVGKYPRTYVAINIRNMILNFLSFYIYIALYLDYQYIQYLLTLHNETWDSGNMQMTVVDPFFLFQPTNYTNNWHVLHILYYPANQAVYVIINTLCAIARHANHSALCDCYYSPIVLFAFAMTLVETAAS